MKPTPTLLSAILLVLSMVSACIGSPPTSLPTVDTSSLINTAVAATANAQAASQATIDASIANSIAATNVALASTPTATIVPPQPTPTPSEEALTLSEEELAAMIDQAVTEAVAATDQASASTTQATSDDTLTEEEVQTVEVYVSAAQEAIAYADELIDAYYAIYGELASETLDLLVAVEQDLASMAANTAALNETLQEVSNNLAQGLSLAEETLAKLETTAQAAMANLSQLQTQSQEWSASLQADLDNRANAALSIKPGNPPADLQAALASALSYLDLVRNSLADNKVTRPELNAIAELGANASAGLQAFGGPQLQGLSGSINQLTSQLARGQFPQAHASLGNFEADLAFRSSGLSLPSGGGIPQPPRP